MSMRTAVMTVAFLVGAAAIPSSMGAGQAAPAPDEGGPVYPEDKDVGGGARDVPWSAVIAGTSEPGERMILTGTVVGRDGKPREGVTVYAYQTDEKGLYREKASERPRLRGWARTNAEGRYEFQTIKPGSYPGTRNPAHVHMTIAVPGKVEWWIPELRFAGDPFLSARETEPGAQGGTFAGIRPLERQADGTLRCVRDIRLPQGW